MRVTKIVTISTETSRATAMPAAANPTLSDAVDDAPLLLPPTTLPTTPSVLFAESVLVTVAINRAALEEIDASGDASGATECTESGELGERDLDGSDREVVGTDELDSEVG